MHSTYKHFDTDNEIIPHQDLRLLKKQIPWFFRLGSNRELSRLIEHLHEDETVLGITTGRYSGGRGLLTLTDQRLLFTYDGWAKSASEGAPLEHVSSIEWTKSWFRGTINVYSTGNDRHISRVYYGGRDLVLKARSRMKKVKTEMSEQRQPVNEKTVKLSFLSELLEEQRINIGDFQQKKNEILGIF